MGTSGPIKFRRHFVIWRLNILAGRAAFYSKAQLRVDTSAQPLQETFALLRQTVREALQLHLDGRFAEARACCERALAAFPDHPEVLGALALAEHQLGNVERAVFVVPYDLAARDKLLQGHAYLWALVQTGNPPPVLTTEDARLVWRKAEGLAHTVVHHVAATGDHLPPSVRLTAR